ncbi:hypothetical protein [Roseovarius aestuarii]|uniref:Uncharacterized protein n=1 Tax=Roseovarius aestuarii TaxID=475083 RepID=A0A1X7BQD7_9RHOB|nr:hypothetical protein [Roseovarius aestuarii]SMC11896.1 hypothetical protein ROA7745_01716 [Roseovarius aestuarii]
MDRYKNYIRTLSVIAILALPALTIRLLSAQNEDLYLLPLAPTNEARLTDHEGKERKGFARIDVRVDWPQEGSETVTQAKLESQISKVLKHQTEFYKIEFTEQPGTRIDVTFTVGQNIYGPFPPEGMIEGIRVALVALRMTNGPEAF